MKKTATHWLSPLAGANCEPDIDDHFDAYAVGCSRRGIASTSATFRSSASIS